MNDYKEFTDKELTSLLNGGDRKAFEVIYRRHMPELYRFARRNIGLKEDCEEIVQDVFESLWARHQSLTIKTELRFYLLSMVKYKLIRYVQRKGVRKRYEGHYRIFATVYDTMPDQEVTPETICEGIRKHLAELPKRCQQVVELRLFENLSNPEIAQRMNVDKRTVEGYFGRAYGHLRGFYDELYKPG